ncbi:MAG TPA: hypothetical protein HA362_05720 [Nanoarchaeota archaeon]|nr:hypothetical protein [Nanoarchaeota archaeon]
MNKLKQFGAIFMLIALAAVMAFSASAQESYVIDKVFVNDVEVDGDSAQVDIGQSVEVVVELKASENLTESRDAKVTVELDGYEHDTIRESTDMFTVSPGNVRYRKTLVLEIPSDMEEDTYTLYVRVSDRLETVEKQFTLYAEKTRHLIDLIGIVVPTPYVNAGTTASVKVRLENVGAKTEDSVKVVAAIEKLGLSDVEWVDLVPSEIIGDDEEESETVTLLLPIPKETPTGEYELAVGIAYNDGYKTSVAKTTINVKGVAKEEKKEETGMGAATSVSEPAKPLPPEKALVLAFDTTSQSAELGKEVAYKITISNMGADAKTLSLSTAGAQLFADARIDPSFLTIEGGQKADAYVYAKVKDDAELKTSQFTLRVKDGEKLFKEVQLSLTAEAAKAVEKSSFLSLEDDTLKLTFIVLVIILIVVGLLIAFRRVRGNDYPLEPIEERTYY